MAWIIVLIILAVVLAVLLLLIVKRVPFPEHWIVDRNGRLVEKKPGYCILLPAIDRVYARVKTRIDYSVPIFGEEKEHWIDLSLGGRIKLSNPKIWINVKEPKVTVAEASDFEEQIGDIAEHRLAGAINLLTPDNVMVMRAPRMGKAEKSEAKDMLVKKIDEAVGESPQLKDFLARIKVDYRGITIEDFDFEEPLYRKREERVTTELEIEIGKNRGEAKKNEISAIGETAKNLEAKGFPSTVAQQVSSERYQDHLAAEKGTLQKIIWQGGGDISELAARWQKGKNILMTGAALAEEGLPGESSAKGTVGEVAEKPKAESLLSTLASTLPERRLDKEGAKKLTEAEKARIEEELNSLSKEKADQWHEWLMEMAARGYLKM